MVQASRPRLGASKSHPAAASAVFGVSESKWQPASHSGLTNPAGIGLGRDGVAQVLEAEEQVHGAVLDPVVIAGQRAAGHPPVVGVLAGLVQPAGAGV
jgi:hypothetical protein